jgi:hypothetical protein
LLKGALPFFETRRKKGGCSRLDTGCPGEPPMILRRLSANLRAQNWTAIGIEFVILVIGVFIAMQVSNWNHQRLARRDSQQMLQQLVPELENQHDFFESARDYYAHTRHYADTAFAGWRRDPRVSDEQFVLAAYQASQIYGIGTNAVNWTTIFGGEQLRNIQDPRIRRNLGLIMSNDYDPVKLSAVATRYREQVRHIIPADLQDRIRQKCGDQNPSSRPNLTMLPATCPLKLSPEAASSTAAALRANPELEGELRWHLAAVATLLGNARLLEGPIRTLHDDLVHKA